MNSIMFKSAGECAGALKQITSSPQLLSHEKHVYSDLLTECIGYVPTMGCSDLNVFAKSVLIISRKFRVDLNSALFKSINSRIAELISETGCEHALVGAVNSLSQIIRERHDGGPPALRPELVWRLASANHTEWNCLDKCELLSVMSRVNMRPPESFLEANFAESLKFCEENSNKVIGRICGSVLALAKMGYFDSPLFESLLDLIPSRIDRLSSRELSNVLYAISYSSVLGVEKFTQLAAALVTRLERSKETISDSSFNQIGVASIGFASGAFFNEIFCDDAKRRLSERAVKLAQEKKDNELTTSKAQKIIKESLDILGISQFFSEEFAVGPYRIDLACQTLSLLIEINGPFHYYFRSSTLTAKSEYKLKVLERLGFKVLEIDFMELKDHRDRVRLMDQKLRSFLCVDNPRIRLKTHLANLIDST